MEATISIKQFVKPTTLKEVILIDGFKRVLRQQKSTVNLDNVKAVNTLYMGIINHITYNFNANKFKNHQEVIKAMENVLGITGPKALAEFFDKYYNKLKKANFFMSILKKKKETRTAYRKGSRSYIDKDTTRTLAVRSKYGNTPVMFYELNGAVDGNNKELTLIKQSYKYDTGCNYYEVRPILLETWLNLPEWNQQQTCRTEVVDN